MKRAGAVLVALCIGASSCGKKPKTPPGTGRTTPGPETSGAAAEAGEAAGDKKDEEREVGVGDFIDYAIGKKQMDIGKRMKKKIKAIETDYNKRLGEQIGE